MLILKFSDEGHSHRRKKCWGSVGATSTTESFPAATVTVVDIDWQVVTDYYVISVPSNK